VSRALGALLVAMLASACQQGITASESPQIVIASDMPETWTPAWEQAVAYAIRQQGGIGGFKLSYWPLDDSLGPDPFQLRGLENVKRMEANRWVLGMISASSSHITLVELPEANSAGLAMVSPTNTRPCLTVAAPDCDPEPGALRPSGVNNFFRIAPRDPLQGTAIARYAANTYGTRRVAVFNEWEAVGETYVSAFADELRKHGGSIVLEQAIPPDTTSFVDFLKQAQARDVQAVYGVGSAERRACKAAAQMRTILPRALFLVTDGITLDSNCAADIGPDAAEGILGTKSDVDPTSSDDPQVKKLVDAYRHQYPRPSDIVEYTFAAYDCARILIAAIGQAIQSNGGGFPSRSQVVAALQQTRDFHGVTGTYSFDSNGDATVPMMELYQFHAGRWVPVS
jgi:branched-chain amino acid transport system substrate-binding protein